MPLKKEAIKITLYKPVKKGLKVIGMTLPFVVIGIWFITEEPSGTTNYIMGWSGVCFFGLGTLIGLFHAFDRRPHIIISEDGVWDRSTKESEVKWKQIIEAYPIDINGQKFISIVTDNTYVFKKKQYKWASRMNKSMGTQQFNLSLGQINIDADKLTNLINTLSKAQKKDRKKLIKLFKPSSIIFAKLDFQKVLLYVIISIVLVFLSLTGLTAFMAIMIVMGIAAVIARWYSGSENNSKLRKYAEIAVWLGMVNIALLLFFMKTYDYVTENVGYKLSNELEYYHEKFDSYPESIEQIKGDLDLNLVEQYFANKIEYEAIDGDYSLGLNLMFNKNKEYNREINKWE